MSLIATVFVGVQGSGEGDLLRVEKLGTEFLRPFPRPPSAARGGVSAKSL